MANQTKPWSQLQNGTIPLRLDERTGEDYALGTAATGAGVGHITALWSEIASGLRPLKFVDNGDGTFLLGTSNG